jgi:hypothetical protein
MIARQSKLGAVPARERRHALIDDSVEADWPSLQEPVSRKLDSAPSWLFCGTRPGEC